MEVSYRLFDHTADLGMQVSGRTIADLFGNAALALFDVMIDASGIRTTQCRQMLIEGADRTDLFVNFLREILYLFNGKGLVLTACSIIQVGKRRLVAEVRCGRYNSRMHQVRTEIKAVTHHQAMVLKTAGGWEGRVVFDV
jgi:SHS2 domain-containing protein